MLTLIFSVLWMMGYLHVYPLQITSQWSPSFSWQFKAFKCNLKEFTTKTRAPASLADSGWSGGVCTVILYIILVANDLGIARSFFGQCCLPRVFFSNFPPPPPPLFPFQLCLSTDISVWQVPAFLHPWGLMAGLQGCASHEGVIQCRGWLPKVDAPGYSRHPTSTKWCSC